MKSIPILQGITSHSQRVLTLFACLLPLCGFAYAQDALIGFGHVNPGGLLESSHITIGGEIQVAKGGPGIFEIEFSSPGAFAGATADEIYVGLTVHSTGTSAESAAADVSFVDADTLTIDVYTGDLEDAGNLSNPEPRDVRFFFQVYRIPNGNIVNGTSTGVLASGRVGTGGGLLSSINAFGSGISATRPATGEYEITVSAAGMFAGDAITDYSLSLAVDSTFNDDEVIHGRASDVSSDDEVVFEIFIDDAQDTSNDDSQVPTNNAFNFVIFRAPTAMSPLAPGSALLGALARVEGTTGDLISGATSFPGATIGSESTDTGDYLITISAPGAFAGRDGDDYSLQLQINDGNISDEFSSGRIVLTDSNTMEIEVYVSDVEQNTEFGTPRNNDFSVLIMNSFEEVQSDMLVGKKRSASTMVGDDIHSLAAGTQKLRVKAKKSGKARFFFRAENDGNVSRDISVGSVGKIKGVKPKFFRLTGGRSNVTAAVKSGGAVVPGISPDSSALFEAKTKRKRNSNKKRVKIRLRGVDIATGAAQDLVLAKVKMPRK